MADEVPVSDVLCEAMEYLSKLGSNLLTRSQNLKEKKIRKDKLKNAHALQKAASKVLLICDLSKKSLENVESGVRKMMSIIESTQSSVGGKSTGSAEKNHRRLTTKYEYFEYQSKRLKIKNKIHMKHYLSAKVEVKALSESMLENYPVYHNCRLYRMRMKHSQKENDQNIIKSDDITNKDTDLEDQCKSKDNDINIQNNSEIENQVQAHKRTENDEEQSAESVEKDINVSEDKDINESTELGTLSEHETSRQVEGKVQKSKKIGPKSKILKSTKKFRNIKVFDDNSDTDNDSRKCIENVILDEEHSSKEDNKDSDKMLADGKSQNKLDTEKKSVIEHQSNLDEHSSSEANKPDEIASGALLDSEGESLKESSRNSIVNDNHINPKNNTEKTLSDEEHSGPVDNRDSNNIEDVLSNDLGTEKTILSENQNNIDKDANKPDEVASVTLLDSEEEIDKESNESMKSESKTEKRPLLKCVNIKNLLKLDILEKNESETKLKTQPNNNKVQKSSTKTKRNKSKDISSQDSDEEYWKKKRREVEKFKSKMFTVSVARLPELSVKFLSEHNLNKITQNGSVICEIKEIPNITIDDTIISIADDSILKNSDAASNKTMARETSNVKNSLLDSDSDNIESNITQNEEEKPNSDQSDETANTKSCSSNRKYSKTKDVTNIDSGENNSRSDDESHDATNLSQDKPECDDKTVSNEKNNVEQDIDPEKVKNYLLKDSNSDSNEDKCEDVNEKEKSSTPNKDITDGEEPNGSKKSDGEDKIKTSLLNDSSDDATKTGQKESSIKSDCDNTEKIKSALLDDSSNDTLKQRKRSREDSSPKSKKKHMMESISAKKMLLTYSSSSDTEDEKLKSVFKEIKSVLLEGSDDDTVIKEVQDNHRKKLSMSSDSEDIDEKIRHKNKKLKHSRKKKVSEMDENSQSCNGSGSQVRSK